MDFFKYAEGKLILAFILLFIILCAGAWGSYLLWMNRKNKLKEAIQEENELVVVQLYRTCNARQSGRSLGLYIGVIGTLCSVVIAIFVCQMKSDTYCRYLPVCSSWYIRLPGVLARLFAELYAHWP